MTWEYDGGRVIRNLRRFGYRGIRSSVRRLPETFLWALQVDLGWAVAFWLIAVACGLGLDAWRSNERSRRGSA